MKIPSEPMARQSFYQDLIRKCNSTRDSRREFYRLMRMYYLFGCDDSSIMDTMSRFNNIFPHVDQLSSFMFSPETTRFSLTLGPSVNGEEQYKVLPMLKGVQREWHGQGDGGIDTDFKNAVDWSYAYGSMFIKFRWKNWKRKREDGSIEEGGGIQHFLVEPHNFGVLREDKRGLDKQEAFCETYYITKTQLENELEAGAHPHAAKLLESVQTGAVSNTQTVAGPIDRLIVTSIQGGSITGNASFWGSPISMMYRPQTIEDLVEMNELYVYDDNIADFRVVTFMNPQWAVWDRPIAKLFLSGCKPYVQVCPRPADDYFWGHSEVEKLIPLQDMLNERVADVRHLLKKQAHPPNDITGETAIPDEMALALDTPSGILALASPAAKVTEHPPSIPSDLWADVKQIKDFFGETSGLSQINQGQGQKGVRSEGHAQLLSQLGSARAKNMALIVENSLDAIATLIVKLNQRYDKSPYREEKESGVEFFARQFPNDFEAKVDGHSSSPVFMENYEEKIFALLDRGLIDKEEALMLLDLPMKDLLKQTLVSKIEPAEAAAKKKDDDIKIASINAKRQHGNPPGPQPPQPAAGPRK